MYTSMVICGKYTGNSQIRPNVCPDTLGNIKAFEDHNSLEKAQIE
jgi:hypothetical protein